MSTIMLAYPGQYRPRDILEVLPVCEVAQLFWMAYVATEERVRRELEAHAYTAWWVYRSIEFAAGYTHYDWDEWLDMSGVKWKTKPLKTRAELVAESNAHFDKYFTPETRFVYGNPTLGDTK